MFVVSREVAFAATVKVNSGDNSSNFVRAVSLIKYSPVELSYVRPSAPARFLQTCGGSQSCDTPESIAIGRLGRSNAADSVPFKVFDTTMLLT